jgi:imidazolonepropionase-like amidohydrolase
MIRATSTLRAGIVALAAALALPASAAAQIGVGQQDTWLITGGTVVVGNGQRLENSSVLIRNGRIEAVGPSVAAPADAKRIDARGRYVYPGMIDSFTPIGLTEIGGIAPMTMRSELGDYNPHNRALVAINVSSELIAITRSNGVTAAITAPSGGSISGQAALIHMSGWTWEDMAITPSAAFIMSFPRGGAFSNFGGATARTATNRAEEEFRAFRDYISNARDYHLLREAGSDDFNLPYESMRQLFRGEVPALISADSDVQIRGAIELGEELGFRVIINGGRDAWKVADLLARRNVPVILGSLQNTPAADAPYDALWAQPAVLHRAGVKFAFSTGGATNARHVPYHAQLAVAYGLPTDIAFRALSLWPAEIFGAGDKVGSIEAGKIANLFISDGDPLDIRTNITDVFINGRLLPKDDRHSRFYEVFNNRPRGGGE